MAVCNAGFELGASGATIAQADRGDGDAWENISTPAGGTLVYDTTHAALGAQSMKVATGATSGANFVAWTTRLGTLTDHYGRFYLWIDGAPASNVIGAAAFSGASLAARIILNTSRKVLLQDQAAATQATSTNAVPIGQWVRIEYHVVHSTTVGQIELKLFNTATSSTPTETLTTSASLNTLASADRVRFGMPAGVANQAAFWMDQIQAGATAYPGPASVGLPSLALLGVGF
jgi:hypothetical protein